MSDTEEAERAATLQLLDESADFAVRQFNDLIADMRRDGVSEAVYNDHPGYGLSLGSASRPPLQLLPEGAQTRAGVENLWASETWPWMHSMWVRAGGVDSGLRVVIFNNGIGNMMDLSTGEAPDPPPSVD